MCLSCWISNRQWAQNQDLCPMYHVKQNRAALSVLGLGFHQGIFLQSQGWNGAAGTWDRAATSNTRCAKGFFPTCNMYYCSACLSILCKAASPLKFLVALPQVLPEPSCSLPSLFRSLLSFGSAAFSPVMSRVLLVCLSWCYSSAQH